MDFKSQSIEVDYITFNVRNGKNQIEEIAKIFNSQYYFNSYIFNNNQKHLKKQKLIVNNQPYNMVFVINSSQYRSNTILIQFSGSNALYLYKTLKNGQFSWQNFHQYDLTLSRLDINYTHKYRDINDEQFIEFGIRSAEKYKNRYPQATTEPVLNTGFGLGTRKGDYFLRIYRICDNSLRFELEIKKTRAKNYQTYLLNLNQTFPEFENLIIARFFQYLKIALVLDTKFTNWFVINLRKTKKPQNYLVTSYVSPNLRLEQTSTLQQKNFYRLLQFLSFTRSYSPIEETLNDQVFQTFAFPLSEFAQNIGFNKQNYTHYQRQQLRSFFEQLRKISLTDWFSDEEFTSLAIFPVTRVVYEHPNNKYTKLIVKISIAKDFLSTWNYPFYFPRNFYSYVNQDDLRVKLEILKAVASQASIRKEFYISNFLESLPSMSNQRITAIKENIIFLFQTLQKESFIEAELSVDQKTIKVNQLNIAQINKSRTIVFYETSKFFK